MVYTINGEQLTRRKLVTIDGSQVTTQTGIPLMLNIDLPNVATDGKDVRLAELDGTPMAREIECVDVPNTDSVTIHYPFDTVASTDSQFYVYWGNASLSEPAVDSTYGSQAVYDSNFKFVSHMNNDPSGSAPQLLDSTSNGNNGTSAGSMASGDLVNGSYGKGIDFDGADDKISADGVIADTDLTESGLAILEYYLDKTSHNTVAEMTGFGYDGGWRDYFMLGMDGDDPYTKGSIRGGTSTFPIAQLNEERFGLYLHTIVKDGEDVYYYINGVLVASDTTTKLTANIAPTSFDIGWLYSNTYAMQAIFYETRVISGTIRNSNYFLTTYKNLNNPTASGTSPFYKSISTPQHQRRTPQFIN